MDQPKGRLTPRQAEQRFLILSLLQWLPVGLVIPVMVLLPRARGLELPVIGGLFALYSAIVVVLELPTGSVADVLGRRRTLIASRLLAMASLVGLALAQDVGAFAAAMALSATARALQSGPLEAWYVDAVRAMNPEATVRRGISRGWAAEAAGLGIGAVIGGVLPAVTTDLVGQGMIIPLSVPVLVAAVLTLVSLVAVMALMGVPVGSGAPRASMGQIVRDVPGTVSAGILLAARDRIVRLVLAATASFGFGLAALEVISPVQFAALLGGEERATAAYGVLVTLAFFGSAAGSGAAPRFAELVRSGPRAAALFTAVAALALGGMAAGTTFLLAAALFVAAYVFAGVAGPLKNELLHDRVTETQRATLLSVSSLSGQAGAMIGFVVVPAIASAGFAFGWLAAGGVMLAGAALLMLLPRLPARA